MIFPPSQKLFTYDQANRALAFIRPIVKDMLVKRDVFYAVQHVLEEDPENTALKAKLNQVTDDLIKLVREIELTGAIFKDFRVGLVDFPAIIDGYEAYYCWCSGEEQVHFWHDLENGYEKRQPLVNVAF